MTFADSRSQAAQLYLRGFVDAVGGSGCRVKGFPKRFPISVPQPARSLYPNIKSDLSGSLGPLNEGDSEIVSDT